MYRIERVGFLRKSCRLTSDEILTRSDFESIATQLGVLPFQATKVSFVAARQAETPERVDTYSGGDETTNVAGVGDWIVTNMTSESRVPSGRPDTYVLTAEAFDRLYEPVGRKSEIGPLFHAKGAVRAIELPGSFDILAPWKERQKADTGVLVCSGEEVYGIEKSAFHRTYDSRGPGSLKLMRPGRKRILSLDGGGVRGMLAIAFLERLEDELRRQHGDPNLVLSDYFDMIGGTSVGAILATQLALGETVAEVRKLFTEWCPSIFRRPAVWRHPLGRVPVIGQYLVPRFDARYLEKRLRQRFGDLRLGSPALKTGLCILTKRVDTGSPWVLTNYPRSKFWLGGSDERVVANREYRLVDVVRASAAAPHFFRPQEIAITLGGKARPGLFVDGAVSPFNNPALQMFMLAGIDGYGFDWQLGEDNLFIVSIGTGSYRLRSDGSGISAKQAVVALSGVIGDGEALTLTLLQWMSASSNAWHINREIGDVSGDYLGQRQGLSKPLLRFLRYDAPLEADWLKAHLKSDVDGADLERLRDFTNPRSLDALYRIGSDAARMQVQATHFPEVFKVDAVAAG
ncbi:MAG TPA: patatin-like phospholipase family protein [Hyphomicrobiaceae bacterium]|nr:patatin-like phospholipase family protein [Hyphomicrobiaceae bacterium]